MSMHKATATILFTTNFTEYTELLKIPMWIWSSPKTFRAEFLDSFEFTVPDRTKEIRVTVSDDETKLEILNIPLTALIRVTVDGLSPGNVVKVTPNHI